MKSSMRQIFEALLAMPYYRNHQASSGAVHNIKKHEDAVKGILIKHGLSEVDDHSTKGFRKKRDLWLQDASKCDMKDGTFISQPCGTHDSPDFIVKVGGRLEFLECKSVKGASKAPMYNSGIPKGEYIYVFTAERYDKTTIYFGRDVCPPEDYELMQKLIREHHALDEKYNKQFINQSGIRHYTRPMIKHVGGFDYFTNSSRTQIEEGVLNAV